MKSSYFTFSPSAVTVSPGNTTTKQVLVRVSASSLTDVDAGNYDFTVAAVSKDGNQYSPLRLTIVVIKGDVASMSNSDITFSKTNVNKGDTVTVTVDIHNGGSSDLKNVILKLYANGNSVASKTITSTIAKNKDAQTTLEWTTDTAGTYTMKLTATYGSETPKELTLTQKVTVTEKGGAIDIMSWLPWILMLLIIVVAVVAVAMSRRRRPQLAPPAVRPPAPRPAAAPMKRPEEEEDEEEEEGETAAPAKPPVSPAPAALPAKPKIARIKCPKCQTIKDVTSPVRPIEVKCDNCGARLRLVK